MHLHILGICGTFMGSLALLARDLGHTVTGSDLNVYPPMSTQLENAGITLMQGYDRSHLQPHPDLVIVGNAMNQLNKMACQSGTPGKNFKCPYHASVIKQLAIINKIKGRDMKQNRQIQEHFILRFLLENSANIALFSRLFYRIKALFKPQNN